MPDQKVTYSCGCTADGFRECDGYGPRNPEWLSELPCRKCWAEEKLEEAMRMRKKFNLPALKGSDKQIDWANLIRSKFVQNLYRSLYGCISLWELEKNAMDKFVSLAPEHLFLAVDQLLSNNSAHFWIDNRRLKVGKILLRELEEIDVDQYMINHSLPAEEAFNEAFLSPEEPVWNTPVEIEIVNETRVRIRFPYSSRSFWKIVRLELQFDWTGEYWEKTTEMADTSVVDMAADAGHTFLAAGYKVVIWNEAARLKAVSGDYEPIHTRWVFVDEDGYFALKWGRNDNLYKKARNIAGSKYKKPFVRVIPSEYPDLLDFAEMYDFLFTDEADRLIQEQEILAERSLLVDPAPAKSKKVNTNRAILESSKVSNEIDEDLRDD